MKKQKSFDDFWKLLIKELSAKKTIRNWTQFSKYIGEDFTAIYIKAQNRKEGEYIEVDPPSAIKTQKIKKHSFKNVYPLWNQYLNGRKLRRDLRDITRHSKYIISIMHQFDHLMR